MPIKYVVPADQTATLTADATTTKTFQNVLKKFTAEVVKKDAETGSAQGDATLAGAVYGWYLDGDLVDTYTTEDISRQRNMFAAIIRFRKSRRPKDICWMRRCIPLAQKPRIIRWKAI